MVFRYCEAVRSWQMIRKTDTAKAAPHPLSFRWSSAEEGTDKTTEIRDPILRLFIEEILRQTPNGEAIRVTYRPNGEWSVLPEATGKADAGLADDLTRLANRLCNTIPRDDWRLIVRVANALRARQPQQPKD